MIWRCVLDVIFPPQCAACNAPGSGLCARCAPACPPIDVPHPSLRVVAAGWYKGALRDAVLAVKDGRRDVAAALGARIAPAIESGALLVPVPTTRARLRVRGMDGVAIIADAASAIAGARVARALTHLGNDAQRGRTREERLAAKGRFGCRIPVDGLSVTLVDDVCTTGSTLSDCAAALRAAGACVKNACIVACSRGS